MSDLAKRLRIKAGMIEMGEMIAWGSDSALMREAADALEATARGAREDYKLVPVEPTPEWVANLRKIRIDRMESVIEDVLAAAPAVQGEPVARVKTVGGYPDESEHVAEWLCKHKDLKDGDYLYLVQQPAEQQPAPDVAGLVSAAEFLLHRLREMESNVVDDELCRNYLGHVAPAIARFEGLVAAHRKQGGGK